MTERKYLPTLSELIDRLSIVQLKEVFIAEHKAEYGQEIKDSILSDFFDKDEDSSPILSKIFDSIEDPKRI